MPVPLYHHFKKYVPLNAFTLPGHMPCTFYLIDPQSATAPEYISGAAIIMYETVLLTAAYLILILKVFFLPLPSVAIAVIVTFLPFPAALVVTFPFAATVAQAGLEEVH